MRRILIVTQSVDTNDSALGFFHQWLEEFAKHAEVYVIANRVGEHRLPPNVSVFSLGKENGLSRFARYNEYRKLLKEYGPKSDGIFFHMCPEYVVAACFFYPRLFWGEASKKTALWYTHKYVSGMLRIATAFVGKIFTASPESFRLSSLKVEVMGHGIDTTLFTPKFELQDPKEILSVSRISPTKNILLLLESCLVLRDKGEDFHCTILGAPDASDYAGPVYYKKLEDFIEKHNLRDRVSLPGKVSHSNLPQYYQKAHVFVNLSKTGSLDKAVLEAMASGCQIVTSNEAFFSTLPSGSQCATTPDAVAGTIQQQLHGKTPSVLREIVVRDHSLPSLVTRIMSFY